ncbi:MULTISPECIES: glucosaminidase domain-containing protein [Staphylococcus]|uniref:glucosaminidase domain-containing protein n=1 Tax=Staphylococcus TaxID=1279 RepID=UPI0008A3E47F|nr:MULTISPECIES: glucosaminidase domain-containing protein [Staphylococcus]ARB78818.1 CHAP domain-containing protein [Staphylococcus lugdunensis]ARJ17626.1 N-acetylmuramoyl-L-alanine amidase [Staphylococcus lugdunensis]MBM7134192.1 glucosaminidase domain-containing protein [Staphylococcus lugdunensis]MCH8642027.1 glucosaminidase domain-containing protein [Staphylococcus lugdunensis]MCH8644138.1 glucosaminidase domain-containing protein [Staphylococcus lugdunensis]
MSRNKLIFCVITVTALSQLISTPLSSYAMDTQVHQHKNKKVHKQDEDAYLSPKDKHIESTEVPINDIEEEVPLPKVVASHQRVNQHKPPKVTLLPPNETSTVASQHDDETLIQRMQHDEESNDVQSKQLTTSKAQHQQVNNPQTSENESSQRRAAQVVTKQGDSSTNGYRDTAILQQAPDTDDKAETQYEVAQSSDTREFIQNIAEDAHHVAQKEHLYASVMIAQAILESDSGNSALASAPHNNLFGVKGAYQGETTNFNTLEADSEGKMYQTTAAFRNYPDTKAALEDYAKLIRYGINGNNNIYQGSWKTPGMTYEDATKSLVGTYSTDPDYDKKLNSIIKQYRLTELDGEEMPILDEAFFNKSYDDNQGDYKPFKEMDSQSKNFYPQGQCTWYVYNRLQQFNLYVDGSMGNGGDWAVRARDKGYQVSNHPSEHTAVSFKPGQLNADRYYGHVAFVEKVNSDGSIIISESNVKGLGVISYRKINANQAETLQYIQP